MEDTVANKMGAYTGNELACCIKEGCSETFEYVRTSNVDFPTSIFQGGKRQAHSIQTSQFRSLAEIATSFDDDLDFAFVFGRVAALLRKRMGDEHCSRGSKMEELSRSLRECSESAVEDFKDY